MEYIVNSGQTVFDVCMATYGDLGYLYQLIQDNPTLVNVDTTLSGEVTVTYTPAPPTQPDQVASSAPAPVTSAVYNASMGQTIYDICLQVYGKLDMLYELVQDSNFTNILTYPSTNTRFIFNPAKTTDTLFSQWLQKTATTLNTGDNASLQIPGGDFNSDFNSDFSGG